ncbi:MAG: pyridoxal phosphate-dependent aminotransferase [Promethearchaeota archaeon]
MVEITKLTELTEKALILQPSSTMAVNDMIQKYQKEGIEVINMSIGQSPFPVHPLIRKAVARHADKNFYLPTQGILPLREKVAQFYSKYFNLDYSANSILIGPGSKILFYAILFALKGPLLLPVPHWVSYQPQAEILNKTVIKIIPDDKLSLKITPNDIREAVNAEIKQGNLTQKDQKLLLLTYPNNPTGTTFSREELQALAETARKLNMIILADEIYALTTFDPKKMVSIAEFYREKTIIVSGLAKDRSLGGYRVGTVLIPESMDELMTVLLRFAAQTWTCVAGPIQYGAIEAYRMQKKLKNYVFQCTSIHKFMVTYVFKQLICGGINTPQPGGGFCLFPNWNYYREPLAAKGIRTAKELAEHLISEWKLGTVPSSAFGMPKTDLGVRIAVIDYDGVKAIELWPNFQLSDQKSPEIYLEQVAPKILTMCQKICEFTEQLQNIGDREQSCE